MSLNKETLKNTQGEKSVWTVDDCLLDAGYTLTEESSFTCSRVAVTVTSSKNGFDFIFLIVELTALIHLSVFFMIHYVLLRFFFLQRWIWEQDTVYFLNTMQKQYHVSIMLTTSVKKICSLKIYILFPLYCKIAFLWCNSCYWFVTEEQLVGEITANWHLFRNSKHFLIQPSPATTLTCTEPRGDAMVVQVVMVTCGMFTEEHTFVSHTVWFGQKLILQVKVMTSGQRSKLQLCVRWRTWRVGGSFSLLFFFSISYK